MKELKEKAKEYAQSITKNETYQKYLIDAYIEGWKENPYSYSKDDIKLVFKAGIKFENNITVEEALEKVYEYLSL